MRFKYKNKKLLKNSAQVISVEGEEQHLMIKTKLIFDLIINILHMCSHSNTS